MVWELDGSGEHWRRAQAASRALNIWPEIGCTTGSAFSTSMPSFLRKRESS